MTSLVSPAPGLLVCTCLSLSRRSVGVGKPAGWPHLLLFAEAKHRAGSDKGRVLLYRKYRVLCCHGCNPEHQDKPPGLVWSPMSVFSHCLAKKCLGMVTFPNVFSAQLFRGWLAFSLRFCPFNVLSPYFKDLAAQVLQDFRFPHSSDLRQLEFPWLVSLGRPELFLEAY